MKGHKAKRNGREEMGREGNSKGEKGKEETGRALDLILKDSD